MVQNAENSPTEPWSGDSISLTTTYIQVPETTSVARQTNRTSLDSPIQTYGSLLGAEIQRHPSPFNEVYPSSVPPTKASLVTVTLAQSCQTEEVVSKILLSDPRRSGFGKNHRGVLRVKRRLA
jgi:hypothetical protein